MKKLSIILATALSAGIFGQMKFTEAKKFSDVLAQAQKENKIIFIDAYASWCGPCKLMAKNIFPQPEVGDFYNANFINTKYDMEKGEGIALAKKYGVKAYPTYLFINADGELLYTGTGYYAAKDFIEIGKRAADPAMQVISLKKKFESGNKDPEFLRNMVKVFAYSDAPLAEKALVRYFDGMKGQPIQKADWGMLLSFVKTADSPLYTELIERKEELLQMIPEDKYKKLLETLQIEGIKTRAYNKETKVLNEELMLTEAKKILSEDDAKRAVLNTKMKFAYANKEYTQYATLAQSYFGDGSKAEASELNSAAWRFYEKIDDKKALLHAVKWAEQSVKLDESYANTDTLAHLYFKVGDKANAKKWALRSIELGKKDNEDVTDTEKLLKKL